MSGARFCFPSLFTVVMSGYAGVIIRHFYFYARTPGGGGDIVIIYSCSYLGKLPIPLGRLD